MITTPKFKELEAEVTLTSNCIKVI